MTEKNTNIFNNDSKINSSKSTTAFAPIPISLQNPEETPAGFCPRKNIFHEKITNIFIAIGIPAHVQGYHFLREAIQLATINFDLLNCVTKELYPLVASRFKTNAPLVERNIRKAIEIACNRGKMIKLNTIFGNVIFEQNYKPTNRELIALLVEKIYLDCEYI